MPLPKQRARPKSVAKGKKKPPRPSKVEEGLRLIQAGRPKAALRHLDPRGGPVAVYLLAVARYQLGQIDEAEAVLQPLVERGPAPPPALDLLGQIRQDRGDLDGAEALYRAALARTPEEANFHNNLGTVLRARGDEEAALEAFEAARLRAPGHQDAHCNVGNTLATQRRYGEAVVAYEQALALGPHGRAWIGLGKVQLAAGDVDAALAAWRKALEVPAVAEAAAWLSAHALPPVFESEAEQRAHVARVEAEITRLTEGRPSPPMASATGEGVAFHLHYQARDHRETQARLGRFRAEAVAPLAPSTSPRPARVRPKVAYVGHHLREHTVGRFVHGWTKHMDDAQLDLHFFAVGGRQDELTETLAARAPMARLSPALDVAAQQLEEAALDIIIYPELGMYPPSMQLAAMRLAPLQAVAVGHPVTTGLPTVDAFLSGEDVEPENGAAHYTEALVRLPGSSLCVEEPRFDGVQWRLTEVGVPEDAFVFLSLQSLFKYLPEHDGLYAEVLGACPGSWLVFLSSGDPRLDARFVARMRRSFRTHQVDFDARCRLIPRLPLSAFLGVYRQGHVVLDVPSFSGGSTSLEALSAGLPIVSWPSLFARGRYSAAFSRALGVEEAVVDGGEAYVAAAQSLFESDAARRALKGRILERKGVLFDDLRPVRAIEAWCRKS